MDNFLVQKKTYPASTPAKWRFFLWGPPKIAFIVAWTTFLTSVLWKWPIFSFRKNVSGIQTCKIKSFFIMRTAKNRIRCCMKGCFCIKECCGNGKFYHSRKTFPASTPAKWRDVLFRGQPMTALVVARKYCFQNGNIFVLVKLIRHKQMENWDIFYADSQRPH